MEDVKRSHTIYAIAALSGVLLSVVSDSTAAQAISTIGSLVVRALMGVLIYLFGKYYCFVWSESFPKSRIRGVVERVWIVAPVTLLLLSGFLQRHIRPHGVVLLLAVVTTVLLMDFGGYIAALLAPVMRGLWRSESLSGQALAFVPLKSRFDLLPFDIAYHVAVIAALSTPYF